MSKSYHDCAVVYAHRRNKKINDWKPVSHNQWLKYDSISDCYLHKHHNTVTVQIFQHKYVINTGGWDTNITWAKIHEYAKVQTSGRPSPLFVADKFVVWDNTSGRCYTEFYDGIEVSVDGYPLDPQPVEVRRAIPGARAEFYALAKKVRAAVALRMVVGEFDNVQHDAPGDGATLQLMQEIAARSEGLFAEHISFGELAPLFAQREVLAFGRSKIVTHSIYEEPEPTSVKSRLNSSINAAKRAWETTKPHDELYEITKRSYT
jgi:hypothetical protein